MIGDINLERKVISLIETLIKEFKPKVEERTKVKLDDIFIGMYLEETAGEF